MVSFSALIRSFSNVPLNCIESLDIKKTGTEIWQLNLTGGANQEQPAAARDADPPEQPGRNQEQLRSSHFMMSSQGPGAAGSSLAREQPGVERSSHEQPSSSGVAMAEAS